MANLYKAVSDSNPADADPKVVLGVAYNLCGDLVRTAVGRNTLLSALVLQIELCCLRQCLSLPAACHRTPLSRPSAPPRSCELCTVDTVQYSRPSVFPPPCCLSISLLLACSILPLPARPPARRLNDRATTCLVFLVLQGAERLHALEQARRHAGQRGGERRGDGLLLAGHRRPARVHPRPRQHGHGLRRRRSGRRGRQVLRDGARGGGRHARRRPGPHAGAPQQLHMYCTVAPAPPRPAPPHPPHTISTVCSQLPTGPVRPPIPWPAATQVWQFLHSSVAQLGATKPAAMEAFQELGKASPTASAADFKAKVAALKAALA
eukprot:SAG22_NODE_101_length_20519_cov_15.588002_32_plen_321_part_00